MSFGSVCGKILTRGTGIASLYLVGSNAHHFAKIQADCDVKTKDAKAAQYYLDNTMKLDTPNHTKNKLKKGILQYELSQNMRGFFNAGIGYFKGLFSSLISDVIPLALGLTALLARGAKDARTGVRALGLPAKMAAIGLAGYGIFTFIKDGLGVGKYKN